jgi:AcrR family transcriptional regulator
MDEKKLEILERASLVYMRLGVKSVTMDDLARELGISKKTIYRFFNDKDDLIKSIIELKVGMDSAICINCQKQSENSIDELLEVSKLVLEHFNNVNPTVFHDLKKYHSTAWEVMEKHKWEFVRNMILSNIKRGKEEGIYRNELDEEILSNLYVVNIEAIMDTRIFPWPEFKLQDAHIQHLHLFLHGMVSQKGLEYLKQKIK